MGVCYFCEIEIQTVFLYVKRNPLETSLDRLSIIFSIIYPIKIKD